MINEIIEVQNYINGHHINKKCMYRICYQMAKWHRQQGLTPVEIREAIFAWGKRYKIHIEQNLNSIIRQVLLDKTRLRDSPVVKISRADIDEITGRFDNKNTQKTALAMLCCFKAFAPPDGTIAIAVPDLANWIGISSSTLYDRIIHELIDFGYIEKAAPEKTFTWNNTVKSKKNRYKLLVPLTNHGEYTLYGNNIDALMDNFVPAVL